MSVIKHTIPLGPTIISNHPDVDGYNLIIINEKPGPSIFIDHRDNEGYGIEFKQDGYIAAPTGELVFFASDAFKIADPTLILLNAKMEGSASAPPDAYSGLSVERGTTKERAKLFWNESRVRWELDNGDGVARHITSFCKTFSMHDLVVCQDDISLCRNAQDSWQRALISNIVVDTNSTDYDLAVYKDSSFTRKVFEVTNVDGYLDAQTSLYYKDTDGYDELHFKFTNHNEVAHYFDIYVEAEVFFEGYNRNPDSFIETFDCGDFCAPIFEILLQESFDAYSVFDAYTGTLLALEDFDAYSVFDAYTGTLLALEDFDAYGVFDSYGGAILDSDDMDTFGF